MQAVCGSYALGHMLVVTCLLSHACRHMLVVTCMLSHNCMCGSRLLPTIYALLRLCFVLLPQLGHRVLTVAEPLLRR